MKDFSQINLQTEDGEKTFDVLLNFYDEHFNKHYLVVCEAEGEAVDGQVAVMPLTYEADKDGNLLSISEIETREEFELIKQRFEESLEHQHGGCGCSHGDDDDHQCGCHDESDHHCTCHNE